MAHNYHSKSKKGKGRKSGSESSSRYFYHEPAAVYRINDKRHNTFFGDEKYGGPPWDGYRIKVEPFWDFGPHQEKESEERRKEKEARDYWDRYGYLYDRCCLKEECRCDVDVRVKVGGGSRPRRCPVHGILNPWMEPYPPHTHRSWGSPHPRRCHHRRRSSSYYDDVTCRMQFSPHVQFDSPVVSTRFRY